MRRYCPLASGSKGNSLFVETEEGKFLIDAGLSFKALAERLSELDVDIGEIEGVVVSHEHSDHIKGLKTLTNKLDIPVLTNANTAKAICETMGIVPRFKIFSTGETFEFAGCQIHPFSIPHDAREPVGFTLTRHHIKLGVCTDLGFVTTLVRQKLEGVTHLILEANHHPPMVHASNRPMSLKQRILGRSGHLSNEEAGVLLCELVHDGLHHVHLAHLSKDCNHSTHAFETVSQSIDIHEIKPEIHIATQHTRAKEILL